MISLRNPYTVVATGARYAEGPYGSSACDYYAAGWQPLPVALDGKAACVSGHHGKAETRIRWTEMVKSWIPGWQGKQNIGLRLISEIGIDVDAYDGEHGAESLAAAEVALGALPPTWTSTSRGPGQPSRIHLFRIPFDLDVSAAEGLLRTTYGAHRDDKGRRVSNVEIIHRYNRYVVAAPSIHPARGVPYQWYDPAGAACPMPRRSDLAVLPQAWQDFFRTVSAQVKSGAMTLPRTAPSTPAAEGDDFFDSATAGNVLTDRQAGEKLIHHLSRLAAATRGAVEATINSVAFELGKLAQAGFLTPEEAYEAAKESLRMAPAKHSDAWNRANGLKWTFRTKFVRAFDEGAQVGGYARIEGDL